MWVWVWVCVSVSARACVLLFSLFTQELRKGAELKRVGDKGALQKVHIRVSDDGDYLILGMH